MSYERLKTEYLCYLMNRAQIDAEGTYGYSKLCEKLQNTEFLPILDMDENRCSDCRDLRHDYADAYDEEAGDILDGLLSENGTMMELFLVMAEKMEYELAGSQYEAGTGKWFKELLQNCGLLDAWNGRFEDDEKDTDEQVSSILDTVIFRKMGWDGEDGMYPLQWPREDQRELELIIQMNRYIEENYDIC